MIKNCYIHIPFCDNICTYCDFCKRYYNKKYINKYLNSLEKEIDSIYRGEELESIYIGGGTPSSLDLNELNHLFRIINKFNRTNNCSITIEANFESIDYDKLDLFKKNNINRISFGLESINDDNLKLMGRVLDKDRVKDIIEYCKDIGINDINVDLIYALPNEDISILEKDLDFILDLDVTHISTYSLILEEHTILYINKTNNISEELDSEMYDYICNRLKNNNYIHYEISNFCKVGYESIHNMCYWKNNEYYGFGLGASGYIDSIRYDNTRSMVNYAKGKRCLNKEKLDLKDKMSYELILGFRLINGINKKEFKEKYGVELIEQYNIKSLINEGLLVDDGLNIKVSYDKIYVENYILENFI